MPAPAQKHIEVANTILRRLNDIGVNNVHLSDMQWASLKREIENDELPEDLQVSLLGIFYSLKGDFDKSFRSHERSINLNPNETNYLNFVITLIRSHDFSQARNYAKFAYENLHSPAFLRELASIEMLDGNISKAYQECQMYETVSKNRHPHTQSIEISRSLIAPEYEGDAQKLLSRFYDFIQRKGFQFFETDLQVYNDDQESLMRYLSCLPIDGRTAGELTADFLMEVELDDIHDEVLKVLHFQIGSKEEFFCAN